MGGSEFVQGEAAASDAPTVDIEDLIEPSVADTAPAARRSFAAACAQAFSPTRIVTAGGMAMALLTGVFWVDNESEKAAEAVRVAAAVKPVWTEISRPIPLYALAAPELEKRAKTYEARRHATGGGRKDALTFGAADGPDPLIALEVYRIGSEAAPPRSFFVDLARVAGADSLGVERSGQPAPLTTRFGAFEAADLTLSGAAGDLQCLGFRLAPEDIALRVSGFACGAPALPIDRISLACMLDRIDLLSAGDDSELRAFFVEAERRPGAGCGPGNFARAGAKISWLEPGAAAPPLRGAETTGTVSKKARGAGIN